MNSRRPVGFLSGNDSAGNLRRHVTVNAWESVRCSHLQR
jgi:hypothetical protein